jgi:hypothetical protein
MSNSFLILPNSYVKQHKLDPKYISDPHYYGRTKDLIVLLHDIGAVVLNPTTGSFEFNNFLSKGNDKTLVARLLGYVAEGIVVRACNEDLKVNRRWANIARVLKLESNALVTIFKKIFYEPFLQNPDEYKAIGTGFAKTKTTYGHLYYPQSDRDICWVNGFDDAKQLLSIKGVILNKQTHAGLQIKVSCQNNGEYVTNYFCKKSYYNLYPVVYFDIGDDFSKVRDNLLNLRKGNSTRITLHKNSILNPDIQFNDFTDLQIIDTMLIRGKNIEPSLHDELEYYKHILEKVVAGNIDLEDLNKDDIILSLVLEYLGRKNVELINSQPASILNTAL